MQLPAGLLLLLTFTFLLHHACCKTTVQPDPAAVPPEVVSLCGKSFFVVLSKISLGQTREKSWSMDFVHLNGQRQDKNHFLNRLLHFSIDKIH